MCKLVLLEHMILCRMVQGQMPQAIKEVMSPRPCLTLNPFQFQFHLFSWLSFSSVKGTCFTTEELIERHDQLIGTVLRIPDEIVNVLSSVFCLCIAICFHWNPKFWYIAIAFFRFLYVYEIAQHDGKLLTSHQSVVHTLLVCSSSSLYWAHLWTGKQITLEVF